MMKMNILKNGFQALIIMSLMVACSLGDVLEPSDGVSMALMETVDTVVALPGDTISFKFIASTNGAALRRIEIVEKSHDFNELKDSIRFALVDETLELTVDEEGYLSRPVSSVMMIYPVIVPNDKTIVGEVLSMAFKAYNDKGKSGSIKSSFKIVNFGTRAGYGCINLLVKPKEVCFLIPQNTRSIPIAVSGLTRTK